MVTDTVLIAGLIWSYLLVNIFLIGIFLLVIDHIRSIGKIIIHAFFCRRHNKEKFSENISKNNNTVSILIPAHNEENSIFDMITSALSLKYQKKEIIVVDDCSTDRTYSIAKKFADEGKIKLLHREKNGSKALALNYGSTYATGNLIMIIDADGTIDGDTCLDHVNKVANNPNVGAIAGCIIPSEGDSGVVNTLTKLQTIEYFVGMELGKRIQSFFNAILVISGGLGVFKKNLFLVSGKYSTKTIGEDMDITFKCQKHLPRVIFIPEVKADLRCPNNLRALIKQRRRWARGQLESLWIHKDMHLFSNNKPGVLLSIADMWINDIILNFLWVGFVALLVTTSALLLIYPDFSFFQELHNLNDPIVKNYYYTNIAVLFLGYLIIEPIIFIYTVKISGRSEYLKLIYLIPLMIAYRMFLRSINILGYFDVILKRKRTW